MSEALIELNGLSQSYGSVQALQGLTGTIPPGSIGLVGANGAGKSTLIKVLLGILKPSEGTATVLGIPVPDGLLEMRARVGYMPERGGLPPDQTAADFMIYAAELAGVPHKAAKQRASDVLTLVGLHEERFRHLGDFSTGMWQRALLAQAIVHDPDVVLLDEPLSGLDPEGRDEMLHLIGRLKSFGINTLVSSHVLKDIESTCDWIVSLDAGRLTRNSALRDGTGGTTVQVEVLSDPARVEAALVDKGAEVRSEGLVLEVTVTDADPSDVVMGVLADTDTGFRLLRPIVPTLEEEYLAEEHSP